MKPRRASTSKSIRFDWGLDEISPESQKAPGLLAPASIARCIERGIERGQLSVLMPLLPKNPSITHVSGRLGELNDYSAEFALRIRLGGTNNRSLDLRVVVARNDRDRGELLKRESANLAWASSRLPKHTPSILKTGSVFQPDRHGRAEHHRRLPAYAGKPLPEMSTAAFGNREQLALAGRTPKLLTRADTDHIRQRVIELCLRAHDPGSRRALPPPELNRGALRLTRAARGRWEPFIAGCPTLWDRVDAVALLHRLIGFEWRRGNDVLPLLPSSLSMVVEACTNALGKQPGRAIISAYVGALESKRFPEHRRLSRAVLAEALD